MPVEIKQLQGHESPDLARIHEDNGDDSKRAGVERN